MASYVGQVSKVSSRHFAQKLFNSYFFELGLRALQEKLLHIITAFGVFDHLN